MTDSAPAQERQKVTTGSAREHFWSVLCHLSAFAMIILPPVGQVLGPLIIWLLKRHDYPRVDAEGKESLNFQISMTIYMFVASLLWLVFIGIPLLILLFLTDVVLVIVASVKTSNDEQFQYPFTIRLIK